MDCTQRSLLPRGWASLLTALAVVLVGGFPFYAQAQPVCVPNAIGVPGQPGPPAWWSGSGAIDDPRWQGAMSYGHPTDDAQFRALYYTQASQKYLVLSWQVKADSGLAADTGDVLHVGFYDDATSSGNVIEIKRTAGATVTDGTAASGALAGLVYYRNSGSGGVWQNIAALPAVTPWVQSDTRLDAVCTGGLPSFCTQWSIRLRVPIGTADPVSNPGTGLPLPDTFRMWYELQVEGAGSTVGYKKWPASAATSAAPSFPDPATWNQVSVASATCAGGVNLDYNQITTDNTVPTEISTVHANVFHARPVNNTAAAIAGDTIKARFRIADWGSVLFDSPAWDDIAPSGPSCATATGAASPVASGANFDLSCSWTLTSTQQCEYRPDIHNSCTPMPAPHNSHQCILVELSSTTGVLFSRASAWNNMNFVTTSKFEREATINLAGLPALPATPTRDVYLLVVTQNMPLAGASPAVTPAGAAGDQNKRAGAEVPGKLVPFRPVGTKEGARLQEAVRAGALTLEQLAAKMPTYLVRVYYDTGLRTLVGGTQHAVLEPMPSFGYFAMHDGEIEGWKHSLQGAIQIDPNFYKIPVPHGGSVKVKNTIESVEATPVSPVPPVVAPPGVPWWLWLLILLVIGAALAWRLLRKP
jgi:hypothetical protein